MKTKRSTFFKVVRSIYGIMSIALVIAAFAIVPHARDSLFFQVLALGYGAFALLAAIGATFAKKMPSADNSLVATYAAPIPGLAAVSTVLVMYGGMTTVVSVNVFVAILLLVLLVMYAVHSRTTPTHRSN